MTKDEHAFSLRFSRRYCMAHRLMSGAAPRCSVPHGHDEVVTVDLVERSNADLNPDTNMLVEFDQAKRRWFDWIDTAVDHSFQVGNNDPLIGYFQSNEAEILPRLLITPGDPTTEVRAACYTAKLSAFLASDNPDFQCQKLVIQETPTNSVEYRPSVKSGVVSDGDDHWWNRPDMTINDLLIN